MECFHNCQVDDFRILMVNPKPLMDSIHVSPKLVPIISH
jgi:hypothetical protein